MSLYKGIKETKPLLSLLLSPSCVGQIVPVRIPSNQIDRFDIMIAFYEYIRS